MFPLLVMLMPSSLGEIRMRPRLSGFSSNNEKLPRLPSGISRTAEP